jgi:hypothetical protein
LEQREFAGSQEAARAVAEGEVNRDEVAGREHVGKGRCQGRARFVGALRCEVLAPGGDLHTEGQADSRHFAADLAETQDAQARS